MLMSHAGKALRRQEIFDAIWGADFLGETGSLDTYIGYLRRKLEPDIHHPQFIETVHGVGYRFTSPNLPSSPK